VLGYAQADELHRRAHDLRHIEELADVAAPFIPK
jgi:hypothetical protein